MRELKIVNASHFQSVLLEKQVIMYCKSSAISKMRDSIHSLKDALNLNCWKNYFDPFACIIVDHLREEIILVRDHIGVQPLYYFLKSNQFIFGQTLPDIIQQLPSLPLLNQIQMTNLFSDRNIYSDETFYQDIYRVEPGHLMHFKVNKACFKKSFWQLEPEGDMLHYTSSQDYLAHFNDLMQEAVKVSVPVDENIAAEFSGGIDSAAVCATALEQGLRPALFMHAPNPQTQSTPVYNAYYEKMFLEHYSLSDIRYITVDDFDPIRVFERYAEWFSGPAPHIFYMFSYPFHCAIAEQGYKILLSGLGGDQGVSGHAPPRFILPMLMHEKNYREAWKVISSNNRSSFSWYKWIKKIQLFLKHAHPSTHHMMQQLEEIWRVSKNGLRYTPYRPKATYAYFTDYFSSLREAEWAFLQGPFSYDIRMRIEYSSVVTQKMGFEYRYPLLYPKLLDFFLKVPYTQKRHLGQGRYLMRAYLKKILNSNLFNDYQKSESLSLLPSLAPFKEQFLAGAFKKEFLNLPYSDMIPHENTHISMIRAINALMLGSVYKKY